MPPTLLEARDLVAIVSMNTPTRIGLAVGMIFVIPAWAGNSIGESRAASGVISI
jgi:hypothetical protein